MNAIDLLQTAFVVGLPTAADVAAGRAPMPTASEVVLIGHRKGQWRAFGPYPVKDIEWARLQPDLRIYTGEVV